MATTKYILTFEKLDMVFNVAYYHGKFKRIEYKSGAYDSVGWQRLMFAVPYHEAAIPEAVAHFENRIRFDAMETDKATLYTQFYSCYHDWYFGRYKFKPKMDGIQGKALNAIIKWMGENTATDQEALNTWQMVLLNWDKLELFHSKQTKLSQINSNIANIIIQIKNDRANHMGTTESRKI